MYISMFLELQGITTYAFYLEKIKYKHFSIGFWELPEFVIEKSLTDTL